jgi:molybdate transport system substrate-binding protein
MARLRAGTNADIGIPKPILRRSSSWNAEMNQRMTLRALVAWVCVAACSFGHGGAIAWAADEPRPVLVFDAASLTDVMEDLGRTFTRQSHVPVRFSPAASSALAKQIEAGAAADVFFSADLQWMDYLDQRKLLRPGSRHDVVSNRLVLIAPADSKVRLKIGPGFDLLGALGGGKLATGDPDSVPVGKYARAALEKLGVWNSVSGRIVSAENVRSALAFVARGEAPLGIVYRTDALAQKRVRIVDVFPEDSHPPIVYPIALTTRAGPAAQRFLDFVISDAAKPIFRKYGFQPAR